MRAMVLMFLVACLGSSSVPCTDGRTCPANLACDTVHATCVDPSQLRTCRTKTDGEPCTIAMADDGICDAEICVVERCGDGYTRNDEQCDGVDVPAGSSCTQLGFYSTNKPACTDDCTFDRDSCVGECGDGILQSEQELCDIDHPPTATCVDFGFGAGLLGCANCGPGTTACETFGWQTVLTAKSMIDVHGLADDNVFAIGYDDLVMHFDGTSWSEVDITTCLAGAPLGLSSIWTIGPDEAIAVGGGSAAHISTTGCVKRPIGASSAIEAVWASGPADAYAMSRNDGLFHFDGSTWTKAEPGPGFAIWGSSKDDVYVALVGNYIQHYDGTSWSTPYTIDGIQYIQTIWGTSSSDVYVGGSYYAGGYRAALVHYNGSGWTTVLDDPAILQSANSTINDGWSVGTQVFTLAGRSTGLVVLAFDGLTWTDLGLPLVGNGAIWASSSHVVHTVTRSEQRIATLYRNSLISETASAPYPSRFVVRAGDAAAVIANATINVWDGVRWSSGELGGASDVAYDPAGNLYAVGPSRDLSRRTGVDSWTPVTSQQGDFVFAFAQDDIWINQRALGGNTELYHWNGSTSTMEAQYVDYSLNGMWGPSPGVVFAVGQAGHVERWNGSQWQSLTTPITADLYDVWGLSATDVYLWGALANVYELWHYDGATFTKVATPPNIAVTGVWGTSGNDLFVAHFNGIERFDGVRWLPVDPGAPRRITAIDGAGDSIFWMDVGGESHQLVRLANW